MSKQNLRNYLSQHDQEVLESIFNPLELTTSVNVPIDPETNAEVIDIEEDLEEIKESKIKEIFAIKLAEQGKLGEAIEQFENALKIAPKRASVYNNRAQALRLAGKDEDALNDLNKAIEIATDSLLKTKCHAYCQRGVLYRKLDNLDAARSDFEMAAKLGSKFAREQLVETNPFAAMCNQMLRQVFDQYK